jgi:hypothetical protein
MKEFKYQANNLTIFGFTLATEILVCTPTIPPEISRGFLSSLPQRRGSIPVRAEPLQSMPRLSKYN